MKNPRSIELDFEAKAGYIRYADDTVEIVNTIDIWRDGCIAVDVDSAGTPIGIELLGLDVETIEHARDYAHSQDLAFPNLAAALVAA